MATQTIYLRVYSENTSNEREYAPVVVLSSEDSDRFNREHFIVDSQNNINNRLFGGNYQYCKLNNVLIPAQITQPKMGRFLLQASDFDRLSDRAAIQEWGVVATVDGNDRELITGNLISPFPTFIANSENQCWVVNILDLGVSFDRNTDVSRLYTSPYLEPLDDCNGRQWPFDYGQLTKNQNADYYYRYTGKTSRGVVWATARTNLQTFHTDNQSELLQGGWAFEPDLSVSSNQRNLQLPSSYKVSFGCMLDDAYDGQYETTVTGSDLSSPYDSLADDGLNTSVPTIFGPIVGERTTSGGTPTNETDLLTLAYQMTEDYIEFLTLQYDATFRGCIEIATPSNLGCNVGWEFCTDLIATHVYTDPLSFYDQSNSVLLSVETAIPDAAYDVKGKINTSDKQFFGLGRKLIQKGLFLSEAQPSGSSNSNHLLQITELDGLTDVNALGLYNASGSNYLSIPDDPTWEDVDGHFVSRSNTLAGIYTESLTDYQMRMDFRIGADAGDALNIGSIKFYDFDDDLNQKFSLSLGGATPELTLEHDASIAAGADATATVELSAKSSPSSGASLAVTSTYDFSAGDYFGSFGYYSDTGGANENFAYANWQGFGIGLPLLGIKTSTGDRIFYTAPYHRFFINGFGTTASSAELMFEFPTVAMSSLRLRHAGVDSYGATGTYGGLTFLNGWLTGGSFSGGMAIGGSIAGASVPNGVLTQDTSGNLAQSPDIVFDPTADVLTIGQPGTDDDHYFRNTKVGRITGVTEGSINGPYLIATGEGAEEESPPPPEEPGPESPPPPMGP